MILWQPDFPLSNSWNNPMHVQLPNLIITKVVKASQCKSPILPHVPLMLLQAWKTTFSVRWWWIWVESTKRQWIPADQIVFIQKQWHQTQVSIMSWKGRHEARNAETESSPLPVLHSASDSCMGCHHVSLHTALLWMSIKRVKQQVMCNMKRSIN